MDVNQVISLLDAEDSDSVRSFSSECLDLLEPLEEQEEQEESEDEDLPKSKIPCEDPGTSHGSTLYTTSEVHDLVCDTSYDESQFQTDESSSSDSESDFDLSDPEAESQQLSQDDLQDDMPSPDGQNDEDEESRDGESGGDDDNPDIVSDCNSRRIGSTRGTRSRRGQGRGRGWRGRGQGGRGRGKGRCGGTKTPQKKLTVHKLSEVDLNVPKGHEFKPLRSIGPHLPSCIEVSSPAELFKLYFDSGIVQKICDATNEYAERQKDKHPVMYRYFSPMTPDDFYALVGIFVHLGYRKIPRYRLMWTPTSLCYDPLISKVFSRNKFEGLLSFLHIVDEDTEKKLKDEGDKLCKVRPLNDYLQKRCKELYQPHREISIDERMVRSKARFSFRQYIRNKPTKWGFKLWCLCDSHNGYTSSSVYRGKNGEVRSSNGLGYDVVVSLMQDYQSQGYSLYIDNFYTSPTLVSDLYDLGVHVTGTLDCTRTGVPAEIPALKKQMAKKSVSRGEGSYVRDGVCVYAVWKDTKCVSVMSNEHPGHSESKVTRNVKDKDGVNQKKEVPIPAIIYCYNRFMNGVDRSDQLIKNYNILRQTRKYWKTLFLHYVDIAIVNAYILYKELHPNARLRMSHFTFRETLVRQLCHIEVSLHQSVAGRKCDTTIEHRSERMAKGRDCVYCKLVHGVRRRTTRQCTKCEAPLCLLARNCFQKFHQQSFREERSKWLQDKSIPKQSPKPIGRPKGSTVSKGRGKRKRKNW